MKETISGLKTIRGFLISGFILTLTAIAGRALYDIFAGQWTAKWQYLTILEACASAVVVFLLIRLSNRKNRAAAIFSRILGALLLCLMVWLCADMLIGTSDYQASYRTDWRRYYFDRMVEERIPDAPSHYEYADTLFDEYEDMPAEGWWSSDVDLLAEERKIWSLTKLTGKGDSYYKYDDSVLENPAGTEEEAKREPYRSALDERERLRYVLYQNDNTILNVLSYQYGRWTFFFYILAAAAWTVSGLCLFSKVGKGWNLILLFVAWITVMLRVWLTVLNGMGLVYSRYGPLFMGLDRDLDICGGICIGIMAACALSGEKKADCR